MTVTEIPTIKSDLRVYESLPSEALLQTIDKTFAEAEVASSLLELLQILEDDKAVLDHANVLYLQIVVNFIDAVAAATGRISLRDEVPTDLVVRAAVAKRIVLGTIERGAIQIHSS